MVTDDDTKALVTNDDPILHRAEETVTWLISASAVLKGGLRCKRAHLGGPGNICWRKWCLHRVLKNESEESWQRRQGKAV